MSCQEMRCQKIHTCIPFIRIFEEWKEIIKEVIYLDYSLNDISDILKRKFLKANIRI
jgi:methyl coenzyme M reductase subunit C-like uncharacterized protein (methanogenesis marker protein 7)